MLRPSISIPPFWRESRVALEAAALMRSRVFRGEGVADGQGQPVLLIPGFLAGDDSLAFMSQWLRRTGHHPRRAGIRSNVDCSAVAVERLGERLEALADSRGRRVAIVGHSRGGTFAKVLAVRHPQLVSGIVTLGSPQLDPFDVHPLVRMHVYAVGTLGSLGMRGLFRHQCRAGRCCEGFWEDLRSPLDPTVGYLSIYSKSDGVVNWRACLDPVARALEIQASHVGMAVSARAYRAIAASLSEFREMDSRARRSPRRRAGASLRRAA
ncbi:MAG: hypothetical protein NVSMB25_23610 [Thermoleophilaceae bacterium]